MTMTGHHVGSWQGKEEAMDSVGKFGHYLVSRRKVSENGLYKAQAYQESYPFLKIGEILVNMGELGFVELIDTLKDYRAQCKLGQLLVLEGAITQTQLERALATQAVTGQLLGKILVEMRACTLEQVMRCLVNKRSGNPEAKVG